MRIVSFLLTFVCFTLIAHAAPQNMTPEWEHDPTANGGTFYRPFNAHFAPNSAWSWDVRFGSSWMHLNKTPVKSTQMLRMPITVDMGCPGMRHPYAGGLVFEDHPLWWVAGIEDRSATQGTSPASGPNYWFNDSFPHTHDADNWPIPDHIADLGPDQGGVFSHRIQAIHEIRLLAWQTPQSQWMQSSRETVIETERTTVHVWRERNVITWIGEDGRWRRWDPSMSPWPSSVRQIALPSEIVCDLFHCVLTFDRVIIEDASTGQFYGHPNRVMPDGRVIHYTAGLTLNLHLHDCQEFELYLRADANGDGVVDVADYFHYLTMFFAGDPDAKMTPPEGEPTVADYFEFLSAFFAELTV